jgi:hypothetical protein
MPEVNFDDGSGTQYGKQDKISFRDIVLQHVRKIGTLASCEWRGGFWQQIPNQNANSNAVQQIYIQDTRESYSNAVEYLADLLYPHFDNQLKQEEQKIMELLKVAYKSKTYLKECDRTDQNAEQAKAYFRTWQTDDTKQSYRSYRAKICRLLFRNICSFLARQNYFEESFMEDE